MIFRPRMVWLLLAALIAAGCQDSAAPVVEAVGNSQAARSQAGEEGHAAMVANEDNFDTLVLGSDKPVLVDFWAPWCGPCRQMAPVIEELAHEFEGRAVVAKVNTDDNPALAKRYNVTGIPAFIFFKDGREVDRLGGSGTPKEQFAEKLNALIEGS